VLDFPLVLVSALEALGQISCPRCNRPWQLWRLDLLDAPFVKLFLLCDALASVLFVFGINRRCCCHDGPIA